MEVELETFRALHKLHKKDSSVLVSNGFLNRVEDNEKLIAVLDEGEKKFLDLSIAEYDRVLRQDYEANQENVKALQESEERAAELERAQHETKNAQKEAEALAAELETERDRLQWDLEQQKAYELIADRQKWLFAVLRKTALPAWALVFSLLIATTVLTLYGKETQAFVTILSIAVGTLLTMYATGFTSMFAPMIKDTKPKESRTEGEKSEQQHVG